MSDLKLFQTAGPSVVELQGQAVQVERSLQKLFEANLETLLGVRFLATEHVTGSAHGGRLDTLGIDEDGTPVIIEYKRSTNENVINQGLFYLDWLMDHKKDFQWLAMERLGDAVGKSVDWSGPRLICIAGDFTRYDQHAVKQINRNIELIRYRRFSGDLLLLELIHASRTQRITSIASSPASNNEVETVGEIESPQDPTEAGLDPYRSSRIAYRLANASSELRDLYEALQAFILGLGDDVQMKELKQYIAFRRIKNFACVEVWPRAAVVGAYLKLDPRTVILEPGFTRDVRKIGHFGTGDLEISIRSIADLVKAQPMFERAYQGE